MLVPGRFIFYVSMYDVSFIVLFETVSCFWGNKNRESLSCSPPPNKDTYCWRRTQKPAFLCIDSGGSCNCRATCCHVATRGQAQPLLLLHAISTGPFCGLACFLCYKRAGGYLSLISPCHQRQHCNKKETIFQDDWRSKFLMARIASLSMKFTWT